MHLTDFDFHLPCIVPIQPFPSARYACKAVEECAGTDWRAASHCVEQFDALIHLIILPNYKETLSTLRETLSVLASHPAASDSYRICLACEESESGASEKALLLMREFGKDFYDMQFTLHRVEEEEAAGKSSNVSWAAKEMFMRGLAGSVITVDSGYALRRLALRHFGYGSDLAPTDTTSLMEDGPDEAIPSPYLRRNRSWSTSQSSPLPTVSPPSEASSSSASNVSVSDDEDSSYFPKSGRSSDTSSPTSSAGDSPSVGIPFHSRKQISRFPATTPTPTKVPVFQLLVVLSRLYEAHFNLGFLFTLLTVAPYFNPGLEPSPLWKLRPSNTNALPLPRSAMLATTISSHLGTVALLCTITIFFYYERFHRITTTTRWEGRPHLGRRAYQQTVRSFPSRFCFLRITSRRSASSSSQHHTRRVRAGFFCWGFPDLRSETASSESGSDDAAKLGEIYSPAFPVYHRRFGNPAPLGLSAFALTTFVLSLVNVKAASVATPNVVVGLALFYGGLVQLLAGMWEFAVGNTFGATAFSSYGGFWMSFALVISPWSGIAAAYEVEADFDHAIGFFLFGWMIFTFMMWLASLRSSVALSGVFFFLTITFMLLGISYFVPTRPGIGVAGGAFGLITAFFAWYTAAAGLLTPDTSYFVIPVGNLSKRD
ncbi:uncharacterized protein P7C70_g6757, partial [Phenoliferia sp. Uapishka_3]